MESALRKALTDAINSTSSENGSNTPDYILARYLESCLAAFDVAVLAREDWYGHRHNPGAETETTRERARCMSHIYAHFTPDQMEEHAETFRRIKDGDGIKVSPPTS